MVELHKTGANVSSVETWAPNMYAKYRNVIVNVFFIRWPWVYKHKIGMQYCLTYWTWEVRI